MVIQQESTANTKRRSNSTRITPRRKVKHEIRILLETMHGVMEIMPFVLNNFVPENLFFLGGGGQIGVNEASRILDCDRIMRTSFVERNEQHKGKWQSFHNYLYFQWLLQNMISIVINSRKRMM